ncbi:DUF3644 domain-containing protein [Candidatus Dojkabacteria bacterium]|uniref:DUF3644 domain-containing protein n=1 Tax=Candidatus Dojkabacteria bacterium TaxID=2099670 RepID=A0A5C7J745_9BACT|nr:MAG: DUF3644 domain-containing protein [Candidatus Dojkabacteria bacterium]
MTRRVYSEKLDLIDKSREAMLSAVQIYNNPLISFKTESFIVLSMIAWTYLLHAYYRSKKIEYRYYEKVGSRKKFVHNFDGSIKYWDLRECISKAVCPLDKDTVNNLNFLIGLRNQIEHKKVTELDAYLSARYQACAINYNFYLKKLHGNKWGLDKNLSLSIQLSELNYSKSSLPEDDASLIPQSVKSFIADFDNNLSEEEIKSENFAYRLLFSKISAKRKGQADRVIEFIDPKSSMAQDISKQYWVKEEKEKPKKSATQVVKKVQEAGFKDFKLYDHTNFWKRHDGKNPSKGFGTEVVGYWYWYQNWIDFIISELSKERDKKTSK